MIASITISDWSAVGLVLLAFPSAIVAWNSVSDRRRRNEADSEQRTQTEVIELIGHAFFGPDRTKWPKPGQPGEPIAMNKAIERVAEQLSPSNGKTVAKQIEETFREIAEANKEIGRVAVLMGEHMSDGHGAQVWPAGR